MDECLLSVERRVEVVKESRGKCAGVNSMAFTEEEMLTESGSRC